MATQILLPDLEVVSRVTEVGVQNGASEYG